MNLQHIYLFFNKQQGILDNNEIQLNNNKKTKKHFGYNFKLLCVFHDVVTIMLYEDFTHTFVFLCFLCGVHVLVLQLIKDLD